MFILEDQITTVKMLQESQENSTTWMNQISNLNIMSTSSKHSFSGQYWEFYVSMKFNIPVMY